MKRIIAWSSSLPLMCLTFQRSGYANVDEWLLLDLTLNSSIMAVRTLRQVSTPSSSSGKWSGKSMREKRVWSGRANSSGGCNSLGSTGTWNTQIIEYMGLVATKPVFGISDKVRLKLVSLATETSWKIEILLKASWDMILSSEQITKALISLRGWAGWSAPLLFAKPQRQVLPWRGPYGCSENSWSTSVVCW